MERYKEDDHLAITGKTFVHEVALYFIAGNRLAKVHQLFVLAGIHLDKVHTKIARSSG
jgi:hypothetical protein